MFTSTACSCAEKAGLCVNVTEGHSRDLTANVVPDFKGCGGREAGRCGTGEARPGGQREGSGERAPEAVTKAAGLSAGS